MSNEVELAKWYVEHLEWCVEFALTGAAYDSSAEVQELFELGYSNLAKLIRSADANIVAEEVAKLIPQSTVSIELFLKEQLDELEKASK